MRLSLRSSMQRIGGILSVIALATSLGTAQAADKQPNILVIFGDDVGWMNISSYGGDILGVSTPNIDRIGQEGMRLTSFYGQASCTAGRSAFITGQLPVRTGLTTVGMPGSATGLQKEDPTLAEVLKSKGYATGMFGKNHLGDREEHLPHRHGFDEFWGNLYHLNANDDLEDMDRPQAPAYQKLFNPRGIISGTADGATKDEGPLTVKRMETFDDEITAKSIDFMQRQVKADKPFFVWHNASRLHVFLHLKKESQGKSRASKTADIYGDALAEHDGHVGELLKSLDDLGIADNTIVLYTTDNGAYQYMWPEGGTSPFRGDKGTTWEGGVRVPAVVRWPGHIPAGKVSAEIFSMEDWFPTLAAFAGEPDTVQKLKAGTQYNGNAYKVHLDGFDQRSFLTGQQPNSNRNLLFYYDESEFTALRTGPWKITFRAKLDGKWDNPLVSLGRPLVTNLRMDPFERQDGDLNRQLAERKTWLLLPALGQMIQHLQSFKDFPPRQKPLSADIGKLIEQIKAGELSL